MPTNPTLQNEVAEALCSALFQTDFEPLGSTDNREEGHTEWFRRGFFPKSIRVAVRQPILADAVEVGVEWHNLSMGTRLKGSQKFTISLLALTNATANAPATDLMVRILTIYRDVLAGEGVAGPIAELAPEADEGVDSET